MTAFVAHPSVRVRGTEHAYIPVLCQDDKCDGREKGVHMHCPLCTVAEAYQDPVILRAHFRIKHIDKSIDFAGLKVLRCCNHCEIVGTIKGEKRFKGAHWHCYRCRNGFNRRDEAVKHYKTHFRNPHTTFQIQVTQDVNCRQYYTGSAEAHAKAYSGLAVNLNPDSMVTASSVITPSVLTATSATETPTLLTVEPKEDCESNGMPLGAEEEVGSSQEAPERAQTLVLMDADGNTGNLIYDEATGIITEQSGDNLELQKRLLDLSEQIDTLRQEKESMEKALQAEIKQLKGQVASLVQSNVKMFEELQLYQCQDHSQQRVAKLMESLQAQHKELLQAQLTTLRQEIISQTPNPLSGHTGELDSNQGQSQKQMEVELEVQGTMMGGVTGLEIIRVEVQPGKPQEDASSSDSSRSDQALPNTELSLSEELGDKQRVSSACRKRSSEEDLGGMSGGKVSRGS